MTHSSHLSLGFSILPVPLGLVSNTL
jgi:hypothetical protein